MKKISKEFKAFLNKTKQVEFEKAKYEKAARIERPQRRPRLESEELFALIVIVIAMIPFILMILKG